jgi:O-methyltransferase
MRVNYGQHRGSPGGMKSTQELYLDLLKKSILGELYVENELRLLYLRDCLTAEQTFDQSTYLDIHRLEGGAAYREYVSTRAVGLNFKRKIENLGFQHTMIGRARLENIDYCLESILRDRVPGDCIECGVWRGGAALYMRGFLAAHQVSDRCVWLADSFAGLPHPTATPDHGLDLSAEKYPMLAIKEETVRDLFERYSLLDDQVRFLKGWFKDTLQRASIDSLALLRIDGDLYESTLDCLNSLYSKVERGGFVIIDDYGCLPQCHQAVSEFRERREIKETIHRIDWTGVDWRKESAA